MARPHENTMLRVQCANLDCGKVVSTEYPYIRGFLVEEDGVKKTVPVCQDCFARGWQPPTYRGLRLLD